MDQSELAQTDTAANVSVFTNILFRYVKSHFFYREVTGKVGFIIALSTRKGLDLQFLIKLISRHLKTSTCKPKKNLSRFWFLGFQQHLDYFVIFFFLPWFIVFATGFSLDLNLLGSCVCSS